MDRVLNQHGDVILKEVESMPIDGKAVKVFNGFILEKGEGVHVHTLTCLNGDLFNALDMVEKDGILYFKVKEGNTVVLDHEEHGKQTLSPNKTYKKDMEQEFDYEQDIERRVID